MGSASAIGRGQGWARRLEGIGVAAGGVRWVQVGNRATDAERGCAACRRIPPSSIGEEPSVSHAQHQDIRIGTLASLSSGAGYLRQILPHGFESFQLTAWQYLGDVRLPELAAQVRDALGDRAIISSLAIFGNP